MIGELCASHCYLSGGDTGELKTPTPPVSTACLGADLAWDPAAGYYRLTRIYGPTEYNLDLKGPLARPDVRVKEGDWLLAIDGHPLRARADYHRLLQVTPGQKVTVTVNDRPTTAGTRTYTVQPIAGERDLRYHRWVADNIDKVLKATAGRVGYMHFRDMSDTTIAEFDKFWRACHTKDGIIIDVRGNSGGSTEYFLIDKLERRQVGFFVRRNTSPFPYPDEAPAAEQRYVALSNGDNGSCGELFLEHFKSRGLGQVVGTRSWGGLIGIYNAMNTVDGGLVNQPNVGFYGVAGKWWVENHGIDPDVELDNDPASVMAGRDPQLDKAIATILSAIEKNDKNKFPPQPAYPDKR
ncbi:MAG: S41 family peptidase [Candidatus Aminicenantes bacterium]|nr:S41 family peptidase [Candidatus Aminicenantes bacterium]